MLLAVAGMQCAAATTMSPAIPVDRDLEAKVNEIVSKMSLADKVGQMCEATIDVVCADNQPDGAPRLDPGKIKTAFDRYRVGSVLNTLMGTQQRPAPDTRHARLPGRTDRRQHR